MSHALMASMTSPQVVQPPWLETQLPGGVKGDAHHECNQSESEYIWHS